MLKGLSALRPSCTTAGFIPQRGHRENDLYKHISSRILCGGKKLENEGMSFNRGMDKQVGDGILLCSEEELWE